MPVINHEHRKIYGDAVGFLNRKDRSKLIKESNKIGIPIPHFSLPDIPQTPPNDGADINVRHTRTEKKVIKRGKRGGSKKRFDSSIQKDPPIKILNGKRQTSGIGHSRVVKRVVRDRVKRNPYSARKVWQRTVQSVRTAKARTTIPATNLETKKWVHRLRNERRLEVRKPKSPVLVRKKKKKKTKTPTASPRTVIGSPQSAGRASDFWHHIPNSARQKELKAEEAQRELEKAKVRYTESPPKEETPPPPVTEDAGGNAPSIKVSPNFFNSVSTGSDTPASGRSQKVREMKSKWKRTLPRSINLHSPVRPRGPDLDGRWPLRQVPDKFYASKREARFQYRHPTEAELAAVARMEAAARKKPKKKPKKIFDETLLLPEDNDELSEEELRNINMPLMSPTYNMTFEYEERKIPQKKVVEEVEEEEEEEVETAPIIFDAEAAEQLRVEEEALKKRKEIERKKKENAREIYVMENEETEKFLKAAKAKEARKKARIEKRRREEAEKKRKKAEEKKRREEERRQKELDDQIKYNEMDYVEYSDEELEEEIPNEHKLAPEALKIKEALDKQKAILKQKVKELEMHSKKFTSLIRAEENRVKSQDRQTVEFQQKLRKMREEEEIRHINAIHAAKKKDIYEREHIQALERKRLADETAARLQREKEQKEAEEKELQRRAKIAVEDERVLEGVEIDTCPESLGAEPLCETGSDGRCIKCGGIPTHHNDDEEGDDVTADMCPIFLGRELCPPGPDGACRTCGIMVRKLKMDEEAEEHDFDDEDNDDRVCEGIEIESCPLTMGGPICVVGSDHRCKKCGGVPIDMDDDIEVEEDSEVEVFCLLNFGKPACVDSGKCAKCGLDVDVARREAEEADDDEDMEYDDGNFIHTTCPMTMGQEACPPTSLDGRCGRCGVQVAESGIRGGKELHELEVLSDDDDDDDDGDIIEYCPMSMGSAVCPPDGPDGRCGQCGMQVAEDIRSEEEKTNNRMKDCGVSASKSESLEDTPTASLQRMLQDAPYCPLSMGSPHCDEQECTCGIAAAKRAPQRRRQPGISVRSLPTDEAVASSLSSPQFECFTARLKHMMGETEYCPISLGAVACAPEDCSCGRSTVDIGRDKTNPLHSLSTSTTSSSSISNNTPAKDSKLPVCKAKPNSGAVVRSLDLPTNEDEEGGNDNKLERFTTRLHGILDSSQYCPISLGAKKCPPSKCVCGRQAQGKAAREDNALECFTARLESMVDRSSYCPMSLGADICKEEDCTCGRKASPSLQKDDTLNVSSS
eukprot:jgi/Bigna1/69556/fgenesh1_pg.9_\